VQDNPGTYDAHMAPYLEGSIDWAAMVKTLREIGYRGDFALEIHEMSARVPDELRDQVARFCRSIGEHCLSLG